MALFNLCMKIKQKLGQMYSFEEVNIPSKCLCKWIKRIISKSALVISIIIFVLEPYKFLAYVEYIRSYALCFGHSDPDASSVRLYICLFVSFSEPPNYKLINFTIVPTVQCS